jgi:hypothetical protein
MSNIMKAQISIFQFILHKYSTLKKQLDPLPTALAASCHVPQAQRECDAEIRSAGSL